MAKKQKEQRRTDKDGHLVWEYGDVLGEVRCSVSFRFSLTPDADSWEYDPEQDLYIVHLSLAGDEEHITYRRFLQEIAVHKLEKTGGKNNAAGKRKRKQK